ncbi:hypothetical protein [Streptacidiphilus cavernicola]|uniref:Class II glutamine amidotransferase n=1 Tax=Streptacidiphilus cavernicola TaxID=3342716 RepID=A0ABV6VYP5_9ACTN
MCRLILAHGAFSVPAVLDAAVAMSTGRTADHDGPTQVHPNGWGAVWSAADAPHGFGVHRDVRPLAESLDDSPLPGITTGFLAVHARHATLARNSGLTCTHPLERPGPAPWWFMHNGFLPTVHRNLGLPASRFDSREYFDWVVPHGADRLDETQTLERLAAIEPGGSSGNAIVVNPRAAYVIHWSPPDVAAPRYFAMSLLQTPDFTVVASEVVPELAPAGSWTPLKPGSVLEIPLPPGHRRQNHPQSQPQNRQGDEHHAVL